MAKLVVLKILDGNFEEGFTVDMQIFDESDRRLISDTRGKLPPANEIFCCYNEWQNCYRKIVYQRSPRITVQNQAVTNTAIIAEVEKAKDELHHHINEWLKPQGGFIAIWTALLTNLKNEDEDIRIIIKTDDLQLKRLPFFLWEIFFEDRYHRAEIGIDLPVKSIPKTNEKSTVKVLAILGNPPLDSGPTQIQVSKDLEILKNALSSESNAKVIYLKDPKYDELADMIEEQKPQILFFAGHSRGEDKDSIGRIFLSETESITINDLKYELIKAVKAGLQLAVFNSCDGIGIANQLSKLHIPNVIVMREALPDKVAHLFLHHFLEEFVEGKPLNRAVRRARERLNRYERDFPGVMSLPMIWQNSSEPTLTWEILGGITRRKVSQHLIENNLDKFDVSSMESKDSMSLLNICNNCNHNNSYEAVYCEACFTPLRASKISFKDGSDSLLLNELNRLKTCNVCKHQNPHELFQCEACFTLFKSDEILSENIIMDSALNEPKQQKSDHMNPDEAACSTWMETDQTLQRNDLLIPPVNVLSRVNSCTNCSHRNYFGATRCESCFADLLKSCNVCGYLNANDSLFCGSCGEQYNNAKTSNKDSSIIANRYSILETMSENNFIEILLAKDILLSGNLNRIVKKTKLVSSAVSTLGDFRCFFETEVKVLEKLKKCDQVQRNIAFFEDQKELYLIQEYIYGHKLSQEVTGGIILKETEIINILRSILEILNCIHRNGIAHLNVKASNLIRRKKDGKLILVNFSAAREMPANLNQAGKSGTIGYMSAEQFLGNPQTSSDIYSLGMMIIQILTRVEPWNLRKLPDLEIEWQIHLKEKSGISNELTEILNKMIKADFLKRYQSAQEVLVDLNIFNNQSSKKVLSQSKAVKIKTGGLLKQLFGVKSLNIAATKDPSNNKSISDDVID